jgi:hypothetical protein
MLSIAVLLALGTCCVPRKGRNTDCKWPVEAPGRGSARHLSADADFAEDLAIRYADTHYGQRTPGYVSGEVYDAQRDRCMAVLFDQIAREHGVPADVVSDALGRNRVGIDVAITLPFLFFYCFGAVAATGWLWSRYPPAEHGWIPASAMALFLCLVMASGGLMLGEVWAGIVESFRIGNGHMSYRMQRLWWGRHRTGLFAVLAAIFLSAMWVTARAQLRLMTRGLKSRP